MLLVVIAALILQQSPLNPGSIHYPSAESSLYLYTGAQVVDGNMPYRDVFDYHAPLVFILNALGFFLGEATGVWLIELHFLAITLIVIFATLSRCTGSITALLTTVIIAALIGYSLQGGNQIEEYALLFQAFALLGFMDCFTKRRLTLLSVYLIGVSAALTLCLKPSLTVFWVPFVIYIIAMLLRREGLGIAVTRLITIIFSASLVFIVIVPWLYMANALTSCYDQMTSFYGDYLSLVTQQERIDALLYFIERPSFVFIVFISLALVVRWVLLKLKMRSERSGVAQPPALQDDAPFGRNTLALVVTNLFAALLVFAAMAIPGSPNEHIVLQGLICLVIPLVSVIHLFMRAFSDRAKLRVVLGLVLIALLSLSLVVPGVVTTVTLTRRQQEMSLELVEQRELVNTMLSYQVLDEPVIVFGNDCWIYTALDSYSATRYAYQPFTLTSAPEFRPDLRTDFYRQVNVAQSQFIIGRVSDNLVEQYPNIGEYERIFENQRYEIYRRVEDGSFPVE
ncbi:MAG: hypothetical protein LBP24_05255 [Coriobacteriales bacterium]|nr:hypothetical protein [Coriobacteriales bacterium]